MNLKRDLPIGAASLLLLGSFFLPNVFAGVSDSNRMNNLTMIDSQRISFDAAPELDLPDRIALVSSSGTEIVPLNSGNVMDEEEACGKAIRELEGFFRGESFGFDFQTCIVDECAAAFVFNVNDPNVNMIIWELTLVDARENLAYVTIDDETGKLLKVIYRQSARNPAAANNSQQQGLTNEQLYSNAEKLSEMMKVYYGLNIVLGDYHNSGNFSYYRADLIESGRVIGMFGVVRSTGFTMNERVTRG